MHPADDDRITSNPDIAADMDFLRVLCHRGFAVCVQPHALCGNQRMIGCHNGNIRTNRDIVADIDTRIIHDGQIEIGKKIFADEKMAAVVDLHRPLEIAGFADTSKDVTKQLLSGRVIFVHAVEFAAGFMCAVFQILEFRLAWVEHLAGENFFFFCHEGTS